MADANAGWGKLGEMLAGGGGGEKAYIDQITKVHGAQRSGYQRDKAMEDAAFARNINIARTAGLLKQKMEAAGYTPQAADLGETVLHSNRTMNLGQLGEFETPGYDIAVDNSRVAMDQGDIPAYNRFTAQAQGKPYQPVRVAGGAYIEDGVGLGDIDMVPTLGTLNTMQRTEAATKQGQQRTDAYVDKAQRAPAAKAPKAPSAASAEADILAQARAAIDGGASIEAVRARLKEKGYSKLAGKL